MNFKNLAKKWDSSGTSYVAANCFAIGGSFAQTLADCLIAKTDVGQGVWHAFAGSVPAGLITASFVPFTFAAKLYHDVDVAYAKGLPFNKKKIDAGHFLSAVGATLVACGLISLARTNFARVTAEIGGVLHAGGKLGNISNSKFMSFSKLCPLLSRAFAMSSSLEDVRENFVRYPHVGLATVHSILPLSMLAMNLFCARADVMLMSENPVRRALGIVLRVPPVKEQLQA